jgi:hypothetical protein
VFASGKVLRVYLFFFLEEMGGGGVGRRMRSGILNLQILIQFDVFSTVHHSIELFH